MKTRGYGLIFFLVTMSFRNGIILYIDDINIFPEMKHSRALLVNTADELVRMRYPAAAAASAAAEEGEEGGKGDQRTKNREKARYLIHQFHTK